MTYNLMVEMALGGVWVDITSACDDPDDGGVTITRGRANEGSEVAPTDAVHTLRNRNGDFSPRNPNSAYAGLLRRGVPVRDSLVLVDETFPSTVSNGLGTTPEGHPWNTFGSGGTVQASDFNVSGSATLSVPAVGYRGGYLTETYRNVEQAITVTIPYTDVTGGPIHAALLFRAESTTTYYEARATIGTDESITVYLYRQPGDLLLGSTLTALTHTTSQAVTLVAMADSGAFRAKVHTGDEPYDWHVTAPIWVLKDPGYIGFKVGRDTGNSNGTTVFTVDNYRVRSVRAVTAISSLPPRWDDTGEPALVPMESAGIMRRLAQGTSPARSAIYRHLTSTPSRPMVAYWPMEDESGATQLASAVGHQPITVAGDARVAGYSEVASSAPIVTLALNSQLDAYVPPCTESDGNQVRFLLVTPSSWPGSTTTVVTWVTNKYVVDCRLTSGGGLTAVASNASGSGTVTVTLENSTAYWVSVQLSTWTVLGTGLAILLGARKYRSTDLLIDSSTASGLGAITPGVVNRISFRAALADWSAGHASVHTTAVLTGASPELEPTVIQALSEALPSDVLSAYVGETAGERIERLCAEDGIDFSRLGTVSDTERVGEQGVATLLDLCRAAAEADGGTLHEQRGHLGLAYRPRKSLYNQTPYLELDYDLDHLVPPFEPTDDDQSIRNDVTVKRDGGSSARATVDTGPMSTQEPPDGVGRYDESVSLSLYRDKQLKNQAGWRAHLGTVDEPRIPRVTLDRNYPGVSGDATLNRQILDLDLDERLTIANVPFTADDVSQLARGMRESFSVVHHRIEVNCEPESPYQVLQLDTPGLCKLDTDGTEIRTPIDQDDLTVNIEITSGPLWTENPSDLPIPVTAGDEDMSITAVSTEILQFVGVGTPAHGDNASVVPGLPAGLQDGDLLVTVAAIRSLTAFPSGTTAPDSAFLGFPGDPNVRLIGRICTNAGTETAPTILFTGGAAGDTTTAVIFALRGPVTALSPVANLIPVQYGQQNASAQDIAVPGIRPPAHSFVLYVGWKQDDCTSVSSPGTEIVEATSTTGNDQTLVLAYSQNVAGTVISPGSFTVAGGASAVSKGLTIAFLADKRQILTVARGVNGIFQSHAAGTALRLTRPATLAL